MCEIVRDRNVKDERGNQPQKCKKRCDSGQENQPGPLASQRHPVPRVAEKADGRDAGYDYADDPKK